MAQAITIIPPPDEGELGPAMLALQPRQRAFVMAMLEIGAGPGNYSTCARMAGYDNKSLADTAHRLAHDDKVQAALIEEAKKRLGAATIFAVSTLVELISRDELSAKDKMRGIEMILNRTGLPAISEQRIKVEHTLSEAEMVKKISQLAGQLGVDPKALLGRAAPEEVQEAEFTELPAGGAADLGDLLG